ncbi:M48 family metallopeptidase [Candidatus Kaiserbacteria bacterium]|nr:M48 family metallopeptidase [Candidatus Kaiserbacteria bacterium]
MNIPYEINVSPRARAMRIAVLPDGIVRVTVPQHFSAGRLESFVSKYAEWIRKSVARTRGRTVIPAEKARIPEYKTRAEALVHARVAHFAGLYGVTYKKISVRAQKTRWGSCSKAGNLSFNYKIALLPHDIVDYIVVHEVCHLLSFDHSPRFWAQVERAVPEHRKLRRALRTTVISLR